MGHAPGPRTTQPLFTGILARTIHEASSVAQELNIQFRLTLSPQATDRGRGMDLGALLVTEDCWEHYQAHQGSYAPLLKRHAGYVFRLGRRDPQRGQ